VEALKYLLMSAAVCLFLLVLHRQNPFRGFTALGAAVITMASALIVVSYPTERLIWGQVAFVWLGLVLMHLDLPGRRGRT
jgi:hypothetical protein